MKLHLNFLVRSYEPELFWFEPFDLLRKLVQTTLVSFLFDGEPTQLVLTMLLCLTVIGVTSYFRPYKEDSDDRLAIATQCSIFLMVFCALLRRVDVAGDDGAFTSLLFVIVFIGPILAVGALLYAVVTVAKAFSAEDIAKLEAAIMSCEDIEATAAWANMEGDIEAAQKNKKPLKDFQLIWLQRLKECVHIIKIEPVIIIKFITFSI